MPGRRLAAESINQDLCRRCQNVEPAIVVRTEPVCKDCFAKYVQTKVVKRMESFRVRNSELGRPRKLLLPLSYDASSVALLRILSQHLKGQSGRTGRTGYDLCILHIDHADDASGSPLANVKAQFPEHEYHTAALSDVVASEDLSNLFTDPVDSTTATESPQERLESILSASKSATSRSDTLQLLRQRLIVRVAKEKDCEAIIWPDSTTKLAERTLAETAKGRGFSLPWVVTDGESPHGVSFYYPMRELLTKEIEAYVSFADPPLDELLVKVEKPTNVSTKHMTIDNLMAQYFESVEQDFPSIVANVVRTTGKLQAPSLSEVEQQCELCDLPLLKGQAPEKSRLCYGCIRTIPQAVG